MTGKPPSALEHWDEIARRLEGRHPALFLDYDGTLSPIAPRPDLAILPEATREVLRRLAERYSVAVLSGRGRDDVAARVGLDGLVYAGSHGFEIAGPGWHHEVGEGLPEQVAHAAADVHARLAGVPGVLVEPKRYSVSVHYRLADPAAVPGIERAVDEVLAAHHGLRKMPGKKLFELRPALDWDKGKALLWILDEARVPVRPSRPCRPFCPLYIGDDLTDEDAFRAAASAGGIGIVVADAPQETAAGYSLRDPEEVRELLEKL